MIQKTYFSHNEKELENIINEIKNLDELKSAKGALALFYCNGLSEAEASKYIDIFRNALPQIKISGISVITSRENWNEKGVSLSLLLFESTNVDIYGYDASEYDEDMVIHDFSEKIEQTKDAKVILTYPVNPVNDFTKILEAISDRYKEIIFFGALAAARDYESGKEGSYYSPKEIADSREKLFGAGHLEHLLQGVGTSGSVEAFSICDRIIDSGYVFVILSGDKLQCLPRYTLGWRPLGIGLPIKRSDKTDEMGNACITKIDGIPAVEIYEKYLDVQADEYFLDNVCEFPFVVNRNGTDIARVPLYVGENGEIYFSGDIRSDEEIRLSYVNPEELFEMSKEAAEQTRAFEPQAMIMTICYNRFHFLKELEHTEIDYFEDVSQELIYAFGGYEILKGFDCGGILNSAFISLALKEGDDCECEHCTGAITIPARKEEKRLKSFGERMTTFIESTTKELEKAYEEANDANTAKSAFLSNMSHEIRTPINAILGMNEMILRESEDENILEYAANINSASNSLLGIVNDILDFSKINAGKMEIIPVEYELASLLNDLINMVQKRAEDKGLKIRINVNPTIPHLLYGDEIRLKQVITNILTNAVKYTEKGGVVLVIDYDYSSEAGVEDFDDSMSCSLDGDIRCCGNKNLVLKVSVEDTGIGIKEEDLPKLFNTFERVDEKRNRTIEGTGLGMSITQNLLSLMGSKLQVESSYGVGSRFSFELVQKIVDFTPLGDFATALKRSLNTRKEYHASFVAPEARILVVDDTEMNLTVIKNLLKRTEIQIDTALSGMECLQMLPKI